MENQILTVTAEINANGKFILTDNGGNVLQEGFEYDTHQDAMAAAAQLWPSNSVWHGEPTEDGKGWNIDISQ